MASFGLYELLTLLYYFFRCYCSLALLHHDVFGSYFVSLIWERLALGFAAHSGDLSCSTAKNMFPLVCRD
jgi:hypothetical protein